MILCERDDCEQYQELLCVPNEERSQDEQQMLECHLDQCSACSAFREENVQLFSLLRDLPTPDLEPRLPLELEALLQIERTVGVLQSHSSAKAGLFIIDLGPLSRKSTDKRNESSAGCFHLHIL